ncbi:hypothetical protein AVEN_3182-1 [Araneus ventricosus]|uniref:Uncharacterized protein n=1 Tax=Araneus ventricosus TaxID=182803 RepID=A0A4Y2KHI8_ARAVE|nr:hypothetical protein AVEN_3182-1 [Araneus ventricosus]
MSVCEHDDSKTIRATGMKFVESSFTHAIYEAQLTHFCQIHERCEVVRNSRNSHGKVTGPPSSLAESGRRKGPTKPFPDCVIPEGLRLRLTATWPRVGHTSSQGNALRTPRANAIEELKTEFCHWEKGSHLQQMKS